MVGRRERNVGSLEEGAVKRRGEPEGARRSLLCPLSTSRSPPSLHLVATAVTVLEREGTPSRSVYRPFRLYTNSRFQNSFLFLNETVIYSCLDPELVTRRNRLISESPCRICTQQFPQFNQVVFDCLMCFRHSGQDRT